MPDNGPTSKKVTRRPKRRRNRDDDGRPVDGGSVSQARERALDLAQLQASDMEIASVLRHEYQGPAPKWLTKSKLDAAMTGWKDSGAIEDARTSGRMNVLKALDGAARDPKARDRTQAGIYLARRHGAIESLDPKVRQLLKILQGMDEGQLRKHLESLKERLDG